MSTAIYKVKVVAFAMRHAPEPTNRLANWTGKIAAPLKRIFTSKPYDYGKTRFYAYLYNFTHHPTDEQIRMELAISCNYEMGHFEKGGGYDALRNISFLPLSTITRVDRSLFDKGIDRKRLDELCLRRYIEAWLSAIKNVPSAPEPEN